VLKAGGADLLKTSGPASTAAANGFAHAGRNEFLVPRQKLGELGGYFHTAADSHSNQKTMNLALKGSNMSHLCFF
jgi:hypothetical protein